MGVFAGFWFWFIMGVFAGFMGVFAGFAGFWFLLNGTTELQIDANGAGLLSEAVLHDENGIQRGRLGSARCDVGHDGGVACRGDDFIEGVGEGGRARLGVADQFRMTGQLMEDGVSAGTYLIGVDPPWRLYTRGTWTAERHGR